MQIEKKYSEYVRAGLASRSFEHWRTKLKEDEYWQDDQREEWAPDQVEAYLQFLCERAYNTEEYTYTLLHDMQEKNVPRFLGEVILESSTKHNSDLDTSFNQHLDCPGIILQYIPGFPLTNLAEKAPQDKWQTICEEAIAIVHRVGDRGICNRDVKIRSFIVQEHSGWETSQVFMIDFGLCVFRSDAEDEREFREWQADQTRAQ